CSLSHIGSRHDLPERSASLTPVLPACAEQAVPPPPEPAAPIADAFLDGLKADYPVTLSPLGDGVWVHTTQHRLPGQAPIPSNGLVVVDGEAVTLVDGAWGELATVALLEAVREETGLPVTRMVITHHHNDRISGVDAAERTGVEVFVHPDTPGLAAQSGQPVPDTSVAALAEPEARVKVGRVEVAYPGPGHASDNITVYVPDSGVLFGGCLVKGAGAKSLGYIADADLPRWRDALLWTKATYPETQTVVPGHGKGANLRLLDATVALIDAKIAEETDAG
ncbi:MAG: subclass B1 metallo-beta-lactamase, partial [Pseudomonadota bacterium]